jgi:hypothetical protein
VRANPLQGEYTDSAEGCRKAANVDRIGCSDHGGFELKSDLTLAGWARALRSGHRESALRDTACRKFKKSVRSLRD